jgi:aspartyl protease family protein
VKELPAWLKHATVWLLLALGLFLGVQAWQRQASQARIEVAGGVIEIRRSADGHYHWPGRSAASRGLLVDTGATSTASRGPVAELMLPSMGVVQSQTAGGVVQGRRVQADLQLDGGVQAQNLRLTALPGLAAPLLGMDVLGRLRWQQEGGVLRVDLHGER